MSFLRRALRNVLRGRSWVTFTLKKTKTRPRSARPSKYLSIIKAMETAAEAGAALGGSPGRAEVNEEVQSDVAVGTPAASASSSPCAKTAAVAAPSSSAATAKKAGPGRPKKTKDGTPPKKNDQSPAASGTRGISFFMVWPVHSRADASMLCLLAEGVCDRAAHAALHVRPGHGQRVQTVTVQ